METEKVPEAEKIKFSWKRVVKIVLTVVGLAALAAGVYFFVTLRPVKAAWADWVLNRHNDYLSCYSLPFYAQVQKALSGHADTAQKLLNSGAASVTAQEVKCVSTDSNLYFIKGDVLITYHTRQEKDAVEKLLGRNFFGIPYIGEPVK